MLTVQIMGLQNLKNRISKAGPFAIISESSDSKSISNAIENMKLHELESVADFKKLVNDELVDLGLTYEYAVEEGSPINRFELARRMAKLSINKFHDLLQKKRAEFHNHLNTGFRLESVLRNINYKTIFTDVGLDEKSATLKKLINFESETEAKKAKQRIVELFGFEELKKVSKSTSEALRLDRLMIPDREGEIPNPVLFDFIASQIIMDYIHENIKISGSESIKIQHGNTRIKVRELPEVVDLIGKTEVIVMEVGLFPDKFVLKEDVPMNMPKIQSAVYPSAVVDLNEPIKIIKTMSSFRETGKDQGFRVEALLQRRLAMYSEKGKRAKFSRLTIN